ncbi:hypothetical protein C5S29_05550 [ANME-1 cluster archaeon GoMg3.2]|nr:hypothetical protein [ANME-1 cluster archaeon GoMg3.2]
MAKNKMYWFYNPPKAPKPKVPESMKIEVKKVGDELIESVLKPKFIVPNPKEKRFNYIVDIFTKCYRNYFYFYAKYHSPGPNAIEPFFETGFARMEFISKNRFNLSYMRHTGKWWEIYPDSTLDECMNAIRDEPHFMP